MKKTFVILIFSFPLLCSAQYLSLFAIDSKDFPIMKAKFVALDKFGTQIITLEKEDFNLYENDIAVEIVKVTNPEKTVVSKLSIVLAIDVSGSMYGNGIKLAKEAAKSFINNIPLAISEVAITTFESQSYLNQDFTRNTNSLLKAIDNIESIGGTDYNAGFIKGRGAALNVTEDAYNHKVVIFLTDGYGSGKQADIFKKAYKDNVKIICVTIGMSAPDILKQLSKETGGVYIENVNTPVEAKDVYKGLSEQIQNMDPSTISWIANQENCENDIFVSLKSKELKAENFYQYGSSDKPHLELSKNRVLFRNTVTGTILTDQIAITAIGKDFVITGLQYYTQGAFNATIKHKLPYVLQEGHAIAIHVSFSPKDSNFVSTTLKVLNSTCSAKTIQLQGLISKTHYDMDVSELYVVNPNENNVYYGGQKIPIKWDGISPDREVEILFSYDKGDSYHFLAKSKGLQQELVLPGITSDECLIKISEKSSRGLSSFYDFKLNSPIKGIAISNDCKYLATIDDNNKIKIRELETGDLKSYYKSKYKANSINFNASGDKILICTERGILYIIDTETGKKLKTIKLISGGKEDYRNQAYFCSPDDKIAVNISGYLKIYENGKEAANLGKVTTIQAGAQGNKILKNYNNITYIYDAGTLRELYIIPDDVVSAYFTPDGENIITDHYGFVRLIDAKTGQTIIEKQKQFVTGKIISANSDLSIVLMKKDNGTKIIETNTNYLIGEYSGSLYMSPDEKYIIEYNDTLLAVAKVPSKYYISYDISDTTFTILSGKPDISDVKLDICYVEKESSKIVSDFFRNSNKFPVIVNDINIVGKDSAYFRVVSGAHQTIGAGANGKVEFAFQTNSPGSKSAIIRVSTPMGEIESSISAIAAIPPITIIEKNHYLGIIKPGEKKDTLLQVLRNDTDKPQWILKIENSGPDKDQFRLIDQKIPIKLNPGETIKLNFSFSAHSRGRTCSNFQIYLKGYDKPFQTTLAGKVDAPAFVTITGQITKDQAQGTFPVTLYCNDLVTGRIILEQETDSQGNYSFLLPVGREYTVTIKDAVIQPDIQADLTGLINTKKMSIDSITFVTPPEETTSITNTAETTEITDNSAIITGMENLNKTDELILKDINFNKGEFDLLPSSIPELNKLADFLKKNSEIKIEITGHTDNSGSDAVNNTISQKRADAVKNYLISKNIDKNRMTSVGKADTMPKKSNSTQQGQEENRRVEIKIIK